MSHRTIDPATGETARTFGDISAADLDNALEVARSPETTLGPVSSEKALDPRFPSAASRTLDSDASSELGFGEFVNRKLVNAAPTGSPPWGPVPVP
jgi:succinate-semialdehyde dehydrogenase/glutarate-semialdehyde dehydrogenase